MTPVIKPSALKADSKIWKVGTLAYTKARLGRLFGWLLWGDLAWSLKERSITAVVQLLLKRFQASDFLTGLLIGTLPQLLGLILGPMIAYTSDRHRGKWGRRIPFLLLPTPVIVMAMIGMAATPEIGKWLHVLLDGHSPGLYPSTLIVFGVFWVLFEVGTIIANSVMGALVNDVVPSAVMGRFFGLFRAISLLAAMIFNFWILKHAETGYAWIFLGLAAIYGVGFTLMCINVKEGTYPPPPPDSGGNGPLGATVSYLRECFQKPYYLWYIAMNALCWTAFMPINLFSLFFMKSVDMELATYGKWMAITFLISFALSYPLGSLADRFHPIRMSIVTMSAYAVVALLGATFIRDEITFIFGLVATGVLSGAWMTSTASIGQKLLPSARFAQYASAAGLVYGLVAMMVAPLVGKILDFSGHNYRITYFISGIIALAAVASTLELLRRFKKYGGYTAYIAPE